ncbi:Peptidyl-tRNA hydrolase [Geodia barretti]|uniref:peptidyl-tRNA hydrolase n=1 Tax=Geodia barretti TaxID=519541 RepID=A0AA35T2F4_GEOBA|nr:Peptidyl-tRNA hydrolase [Geodia barretti]
MLIVVAWATLAPGTNQPGTTLDSVRATCWHAVGNPVDRPAGKGVLAQGFQRGEKIVLAKPRTFMNNSGEAVDGSPKGLLVIYDDMELPLGHLRLRVSGSGGNHNGMRSIVGSVQTQEIPRLRIGIGPHPAGARKPFH